MDIKFQSTPPVWGATRPAPEVTRAEGISIHAPRVGGDPQRLQKLRERRNFNPRPPCGGRPARRLAGPFPNHFNPRPPCGGRRYGRSSIRTYPPDFNPRPPCGGRLRAASSPISPRIFQSTPPVWGATGEECSPRGKLIKISIHAPRVGGDHGRAQHGHTRPAISIHAPRVGGDADPAHRSLLNKAFQSTPPVWGATSAEWE